MTDLPKDDHPSEAPLAPRLSFTRIQIERHASMSLLEIMERYGCSKATASRIKNGKEFYQQNYHEREMVPNPLRAEQLRRTFAAAVHRAVERVLQIACDRTELDDEAIEYVLPVSLKELHRIARKRLRELAGHEKMRLVSWRNEVAYKAVRGALDQWLQQLANGEGEGVEE